MPGDWFAGAIVFKEDDAGRCFVLVQDSRSTDPRWARKPVQTKFPGGTNDGRTEDTSPEDTFRGELESETGLRVESGEGLILVHEERPNPAHLKRFMAISFEKCHGELRTTPLQDGSDLVSPPYWVELEKVGRVLYGTHQQALIKFMRMWDSGALLKEV